MAEKTRNENESVVRHLLECIEKTREPPSLKRLSLDTVAMNLWKTTSRDLAKDYKPDIRTGFYDVENLIEKKQQKMLNDIKTLVSISESLLTDLDYSLALKVSQMLAANDIYQSYAGKTLIREYYWTSHGSVNEHEIVRFLLKNKLVHEGMDLIAACDYCLEDEVKRLWGTRLESINFFKYEKCIIKYWESFIAGRNIPQTDIEKVILCYIDKEYTVYICSSWIEYFWNKLDPKRKGKVFRKWVEKLRKENLWYENGRNICYFLVTHATESQLLYLLESKVYLGLCCLMLSTRPEAKLFMSTAIERMSGFISDQERALAFELLTVFKLKKPVLLYMEALTMLWNGGSQQWQSMMKKKYSVYLIQLTFDKRTSDMAIAMFKDASDEEKIEFLRSELKEIQTKVQINPLVVEECLAEFLRCEDSIHWIKWELACHTMQHSVRSLAVNDAYEKYFDFCKFSDQEMTELKMAFCTVDYLKCWLPQANMSAAAVDKFSSWCLLSDAEARELRGMMPKSGI